MFIFIRVCILLSVLALGAPQNDDQSLNKCNITDDIQGECISLQLCSRAVQLLSIRDVETLKSITCGFDKLDSKVCCVTNRTDEALTFKNTTEKTTTNKSFNQSENSVKLPPDPSARLTFAPTQPPPTRFTVLTSDSTQKQIKSSPKNEFSPTVDRDRPFTDFGNSQFEAQTTDAFNQIQITAPITPPSAKRFPSSYPANILPNRNECGLDTISDRIYGGQVAGLDELPWLARIKYLRNSKPIYACHGSLISSRYVVTAGHCVEGLQIIGVRLGEWDTETDVDCVGDDCSDPPEDVEVESSFIYPFYNRKLIIGDIALLRLATPVNFTEFVRPICLPTTEYVARKDYDLDNSYVTGGWGRTEYELRAVVKRKITLNAVPMSICRLAIPRISDALASSSICAGGRKGEDSCAGDSGSSLVKLVSENNQLNWFLYGVTSFGPSKCGAEGLPGIYTRTTYYLDWILRTISANATEIVVKSQV